MTDPPHPHYPDRRSAQFKKAQREREQRESRHDKLCITHTKADGMTSCWCKCRLCWDPTAGKCVCAHCHCHISLTPLPLQLPLPQ